MDTSSSIVATSKRITPMEYLLGQSTITTTDVPAGEWVSTIRGILERCKPQLKYFDGFKPIKDCFGAFFNSIVTWKRNDMRFIFPEQMDWESRVCALSVSGDCTHHGWVNEYKLSCGGVVSGQKDLVRFGLSDGKVFFHQGLYMSNKGDLLLATFFHDAPGAEDNLVELSVIDDDRLRELIIRSHGLIVDLILTLRKMLSEGIQRRTRQLADQQILHGWLEGIGSLIETLVLCPRCGGVKSRWGECKQCSVQLLLPFR